MSNLDRWKQFTQARIGLGRFGVSISTKDMLRIRMDHAKAKDAVVQEPSWDPIFDQLKLFSKLYGIQHQFVKSQVTSKQEYLLRPDLGRRLSEESKIILDSSEKGYDLGIVCVDGLSAKAIDENLLLFLEGFLSKIETLHLKLAPLVVAQWGRVAIGDEISEILQSKICLVIIGERPGLSSADSLGLYLTYEPKVGKTDEARNCISNVRPLGFPLPLACDKAIYLIQESISQKRSGVLLKDQMPKPKQSIDMKEDLSKLKSFREE
ncbi:ethanolamine ammonia-lyase subunit EutC [Leptospira levettii]|uniref:ethanolamine ammonia-lyase subunit EutC n=1 Tax=Leptospira levettii TaxID=2023178 RepID=UPI001083A1E8|nr:ethanolamine ammonia-lyase subunit EutC [Leptospira levettii]TGM70819.1 ethanolamine ammonia-lyase subunit EutC [Leptospira levettii]